MPGSERGPSHVGRALNALGKKTLSCQKRAMPGWEQHCPQLILCHIADHQYPGSLNLEAICIIYTSQTTGSSWRRGPDTRGIMITFPFRTASSNPKLLVSEAGLRCGHAISDYLTNPQRYIIRTRGAWTRLLSEQGGSGSREAGNPQMLKIPPFCVDDAGG
jgi:hypothetical protein